MKSFLFQIRVVFFQYATLSTLWNMKSEGMASKHKTQQCVSTSSPLRATFKKERMRENL